jgi:hypothetical protein
MRMLACCAFAVFLLNQLLMPFAALARHVRGERELPPSASVLWAPGDVLPLPVKALRWRWLLAFEAVALVSAGGIALAATQDRLPHDEAIHNFPLSSALCSATKGVSR